MKMGKLLPVVATMDVAAVAVAVAAVAVAVATVDVAAVSALWLLLPFPEPLLFHFSYTIHPSIHPFDSNCQPPLTGFNLRCSSRMRQPDLNEFWRC